ncbi:MAG: FAD binding domain-containing protein, partial [Dehalococcoidia bacterium]|nr:FAD binding domain-containing protein [Dehalococcoidia bacterium]
IAIGAMVTHRQLERSPLAQTAIPGVVEAYRAVATPRIRNQATVGGGLAHGDPAQDPPAALLAMDAAARVVGPSGERVIALTDFWRDYYETALAPGEILTRVVVPKQPPGSGVVYLKFTPRTVDDYATVGVAARVRLDAGVIRDARVAFTAAGATPFRATAIEAAIEGHAPTHELFHEAADLAHDLVDPLDDVRGSAAYKRKMAVVFTRRALEAAVARAGGGDDS